MPSLRTPDSTLLLTTYYNSMRCFGFTCLAFDRRRRRRRRMRVQLSYGTMYRLPGPNPAQHIWAYYGISDAGKIQSGS